MWIDQRERDSKSGWLWGSIAFHAAIAVYFIMSNSPEHTALPSAGAASETITMTMAESKGPQETPPATEPAQKAEQPVQKEDVVKVAKPKTKVKSKTKVVAVKKPKAKKQAAVKALPKKEVQPEELDQQIAQPKDESSGVVIPVIDEKSLNEEVANLDQNESQGDKEEQPVQDNQTSTEAVPMAPKNTATGGVATGAAPAGSSGTAANPRSYLDLKQKEGNVPPRYPEVARKQGVQGQVQLKYFVGENGRVSNIQVVKSSGSSALDKEAVEAIQQYQYYPGQEGWAQHPISFSLKGPQQQTPGRLRTAGSN